ncbi:MAG TPA: response regulator [Candidatus Tectomicrobia bacterium]|jgi:CheY-like chemotaxis protein
MTCILIIDDADRIRALLRELFENEGYDVVEASNGAAGLCAYRAQGADVVIMDMLMPQRDGLETIRELREHFPQAKIIAISGRMDLLVLAQTAGAVRTLQKPFAPADVLHTVREVL